MEQRKPFDPVPYSFGDQLLIGNQWCAGRAGTTYKDIDPYTGDTLIEIGQADVADVNAAFAGATVTQVEWAETASGERAQILRNAVSLS